MEKNSTGRAIPPGWVQDGCTIFGKTSGTSTGNVYRPRVGLGRVNTHVAAE